MSDSPEKTNIESVPLTKEHPAYKKLVEKLRELEVDGVSPHDEEYITEVEKFVRAEPGLAATLSGSNDYLRVTIERMHEESGHAASLTESESIVGIETIHKRAFGTVQEMRQLCNKLAIELKNRADRGQTPLVEERNLKAMYSSVQPLEDALSANQTGQTVEAVNTIIRALSSIEKGYSARVSEDTESLKKLGFYLKQFGEHSITLARLYGESDTPEALEISHGALRMKDISDNKLQLIAQMFRALTDR